MHFEKELNQQQSSLLTDSGSGFSGILLLLQQTCIHLIEVWKKESSQVSTLTKREGTFRNHKESSSCTGECRKWKKGCGRCENYCFERRCIFCCLLSLVCFSPQTKIPQRCFPNWTSRTLNMGRSTGGYEVDNEDMADLVSQIPLLGLLLDTFSDF